MASLWTRFIPRTNRPPSYRLHKARNLAVVTIDGRSHYLGPYGPSESHETYARLSAEGRANRNHLLPAASVDPTANRAFSINELILAYWAHVEGYYAKNGRPTIEKDNTRQVLRFVRKTYGTTPAVDFGPVSLKNVRQAMIDAGRSRKLNQQGHQPHPPDVRLGRRERATARPD